MPPAARRGDLARCPAHANAPAAEGARSVRIERASALLADHTGGHAPCGAGCDGTFHVEGGAPGVRIEGRPVARLGDAVRWGGGANVIVGGASRVHIGDYVAPGSKRAVAPDAVVRAVRWGATELHLGASVTLDVEAEHAERRLVRLDLLLVNAHHGPRRIDSFAVPVREGRYEGDFACEADLDTLATWRCEGHPRLQWVARLGDREVRSGELRVVHDLVVRHRSLKPEEAAGAEFLVRTQDGAVLEGTLDARGECVLRGLVPGACVVVFPYLGG